MIVDNLYHEDIWRHWCDSYQVNSHNISGNRSEEAPIEMVYRARLFIHAKHPERIKSEWVRTYYYYNHHHYHHHHHHHHHHCHNHHRYHHYYHHYHHHHHHFHHHYHHHHYPHHQTHHNHHHHHHRYEVSY